jgi:hypothetical protein
VWKGRDQKSYQESENRQTKRRRGVESSTPIQLTLIDLLMMIIIITTIIACHE